MHIFSHFIVDTLFHIPHNDDMEQKTLAQKVEEYRNAEKAVKDHPLTFRFVNDPHHFLVIFLEPIRGINAVRVEKGGQKTKALERLYKKLEKFWRLSNEVLYPDEYL